MLASKANFKNKRCTVVAKAFISSVVLGCAGIESYPAALKTEQQLTVGTEEKQAAKSEPMQMEGEISRVSMKTMVIQRKKDRIILKNITEHTISY